MVKIHIKSLIIAIVALLLITNVAYAAGSKLIFPDIDVKVGGKTSSNLEDNEQIDEEAEPGDTVEFRIKVRNNFTSSENLKINDITVKTTIENIDDGSDLEEESNEFDLSSGSEKRITLKFEVPIEVDEDTFDVLIHAEGEDKNDTNHESEMRLRLEVNKKSHLLKITRKSLSPAEISCNRKNVQLTATIINIGSEDEEDITIEVLNLDLGISLKDEVSELTAEPNQDESRFSKTYSLNIPADAEPGSYPITIRSTYDDDRKKAEDTVTLTVSECVSTKPSTASKTVQPSTTQEETEGVELITPVTGRTTAPVVQPSLPPETVITQESFLGSNTFVVGIIIAEVVAVIIGVVLLVSLFRRRS